MALSLTTELVLGGVTMVTAVLVSIQKIKEARARKVSKISPNPKRCIEEAERITKLEGQNLVWTTRFDNVDKGLIDIKASVKTLTDLHLKN
jgi:hypothetical protein